VGGPALVAAGSVAERRRRSASQPSSQCQLTDQEATMSKLTRALVLGAMLAAMNLGGMTTIAQAQSNDEPASRQDARRPPTERQVGESYRHRERASQEPTTGDATLRRVLAREQSSTPSGTPTQVTASMPAEPSGQPGWFLLALGVLAAALALVAGMAVMAARRASRRVRTGQTAA
jgi:hypothetical protein